MTWGPDDEREHPRDPADGRWVDKLGARLPPIGIHPAELPPSRWPPGGVALSGRKLMEMWSGRDRPGAQDRRSFEGYEFWDPDSQMWISGVNASVILEPPDLQKKTIWFRSPAGDPGVKLRIYEHQRVTVRPIPADVATNMARAALSQPLKQAHLVHPGSDRPDPAMEYFDGYTRRWIPGDQITVTPDASPGDEWSWTQTGMPIQGMYMTHEIVANPRNTPTRLDFQMADPDHPGAHRVRAVDLLEPGYVNGHYQILGPDGGWHTIEEVYQDDPEEESMELVADGWHEPALDTSEEMTVRRTPIEL